MFSIIREDLEKDNLPDGPVVYIRRNGFLENKITKQQTNLYDIKIGKGTSKGGLTRDDGSNQGLAANSCILIVGSGVDASAFFKLENELRRFFNSEGGWTSTDSTTYNIGGREHSHKEYINNDETVDKVIQDIVSTTEKFLFGRNKATTSANVSLKLRKIQKDCFDKIQKVRDEGHSCFATAIATGGGKTICALLDILYLFDIQKIKNGDIVAMISPNKAAQQSFIDDINSFYGDKFNLIEQDNVLSCNFREDKINLLLMSTAWIHINREKLYDNYGYGLKNVKHFILDEAHRHFFGKNAQNESEKFIKEVMDNNPYTNWFSGTAQALLANLKAKNWLKDGGSFCFTLAQLLKNKEIVDKDLPKFNWRVLSDVPEFPEVTEELLTSNKLLSGQQMSQLRAFVNKFFFSFQGKNNIFRFGKRHILIQTNNMSQVALLEKVFQDYKHEYKMTDEDLVIIPVTGESEESITDLEEYKQKINKSKNNTITITCQRWLEAVNVPQWDSLFFLGSTQTYEFIFQAVGRLLRVSRNKTEVDVYDIKQDRVIEFFHNMRKELQVADESLNNWSLENLYDLVPIFYGDDLSFQAKKIDFESFEKQMEDYHNKIGLGQSSISDNDFNMSVDISKLSHLNVGKTSTKISLNVSDGKSGKDIKKIKDSLEKIGVDIDKDQKISITNVQKLRNFFANVSTFIRFLSNVNSWEDFKNCEDYENFEDATHVSLDTFIELINNGLVKKERMEQIVNEIVFDREFRL